MFSLASLSTGEYLDILAISCDSFNEATNIEIGRRQGNTHHVNSVLRIKQWCHSYKVAFKINTVVNTFNWEEDMSEEILNANPVRWKVRTSSAHSRTCMGVRCMRPDIFLWVVLC